MIRSIFTLFLLCLSVYGFAQGTFSVSPTTVQVTADPLEEDVEAHNKLYNLTNEEITVKWVRNVIEITSGCQTQICDPIACYLPQVNTKQFNLAANDTADMIVHMLNYTGEPCCAVVQLNYTNLNSGDTLSAVYLFNTCAVSTSEKLPEAKVKVYPNPATDYLMLENAEEVATVRFYDNNGRLLEIRQVNADNRYSLNGMQPGAYILVMEDASGNAFQAVQISVR